MALYYLSSVNGDDATADGTKALPYATLGAIPFTNGDRILVDSAHSTSEIVSGPDPLNGPPIEIISVDWATGTGNGDETYLRGAGFRKYSGQNVNGAAAAYGLVIHNNTTGYWMNVGSTNSNCDIFLHDCQISTNNTDIKIVGRQNTSTAYSTRIRIINCDILPASGYRILCLGEANAEIIGCTITTDPGTDGVIAPYGGHIVIDGLDISSMTSGALINASRNGKLIVRNTPIPNGVSLFSTTSPGADFLSGCEVLYSNASGSYDVVWAEGMASITTAVYRSGGAVVGGSPISITIATTSVTKTGVKSFAIPIDRKILDLSTAKTLRIYFSQDGGATLTDQDIWAVAKYRKPSTGLGVVVETHPVSPHIAGTTLPIDTTSSWTGLTTPNAQYIDISIPADVAGDAHAEIVFHVASPNITVYVDPAVEVI